MVIDCFQLLNELDLLEGRLQYLYDHVDYFVIVESTHTHAGNLKPLNYLNHISRFRPYHDKILYFPYQFDDLNKLKLDLIPTALDYNTDHWKLENHQRNHAFQALKLFSGDGVVMINDLDEIPSRNFIRIAKEQILSNQTTTLVSNQYLFHYNFSNVLPFMWSGTVFASLKDVKEKQSVQWYRDFRGHFTAHDYTGWHLSYWGSPEHIAYKIQNFSHQEYNRTHHTDVEQIKQKIRSGSEIFGRGNCLHYDPQQVDPELYKIFSHYTVN